MTDAVPDRPTVKLRPNKGRRLATGAPWAFADEIALDRRTRGLSPGTAVRLVDGDRVLGTAVIHPESQIAARIVDPDPTALLDADWFAARLTRALGLRSRLFDAPFYRLVHAEGDGLPATIIDRFGGLAVIQPNAAWIDARIEALADALRAVTGVSGIVVNGTARMRTLEGLPERTETVGAVPDTPVPVPMSGAIYLADVVDGQKTGLYFDQRPNHAFVQTLAADADVLDVFSHVGGFALAALAGGARSALSVDSSAAALELALGGATAMDRTLSTMRADAFKAMEQLAEDGRSFDIVVCDPPAFAPNRQSIANGLRAYERVARLASRLVRPNGILVLCSCSHAVGIEPFHKACIAGMTKAGRAGPLIHSGRAGPDHPVHPGLPETSYLKALAFHVDG